MPKEEYKYECRNCKMVITTTIGYQRPDPKAGGSCPKDKNGDHNWQRKK